MSVYKLFDEIFCILSDDTGIDKLRNIVDTTIEIKYFDNFHTNFNSHIEIIKYAYKKQLKNIIVFESNTLPRNNVNLLKDIYNHQDYDIIFLSSDVFNKPTSNVIIYNSSAFEKILNDYNDYIDLMSYDTYLLNYSELNCNICQPILFYNDYILTNMIKQFYQYFKLFEKTIFKLLVIFVFYILIKIYKYKNK